MRCSFFSAIVSYLSTDQDPTMQPPIRWRHMQQQVQKTVELILPFLAKNTIQLYSCDATSSAGVSIRSVKDVADAFGTFTKSQIQPVGSALKEKLLHLVTNFSTQRMKRPALMYILTTGVVGIIAPFKF
jgi:hypothetical protein